MGNMVKHILIIIVIVILLLICTIYPFLPGEYDSLALSLSIFVQVFSVPGLSLSIVGLFWLILPKKHYLFGTIALYLFTFTIFILALGVFFSMSKIFGLIIIFLGALAFFRLKLRLKFSKKTGYNTSPCTPVYLLCIPTLIFFIQLVIAKPITEWSRNRTIANANEFITHLENFHTKYRHYPKSLQAMYKDYFPKIAGIEKYHYLPYGDSYNLSFEQPRFVLDEIGTKEWIVYNPKDEHRVYSHTSWFLLLSPDETERSQGWFTSGITTHTHWKYFLFD